MSKTLIRVFTIVAYIAQFNPATLTCVVYVWNRELKKYVHATMSIKGVENLKIERLTKLENGKLVGKQQRVRIYVYEDKTQVVEPLNDIPAKQEFDFSNFPGAKKVG